MPRAKALFVLMLFCGAALLLLPGPAQAAKPCYKQVIDDWSQDGHIDGAYSARCIEEALDKVPEDIRAYSDFEEQAKAARIAGGRSLQSSGGGGSGGSGSGSGGEPAPNEETQMVAPREPDTEEETPIQSVLGTEGNNADSIPIPLLILLGLSAALLAAGGAGLAARKIRARRPGAPS
jgi:hypothetical protein